MNFKVIPFLVLSSLLTVSVSANEFKVNKSIDNKNSAEVVFDYTTCSAFFAVLANSMGDNEASKVRFNRMSEQMMDYAISLPSDGYVEIDDAETARKLQAEMQKSDADAKRVVRLYVPHCKKLLKKITNKSER